MEKIRPKNCAKAKKSTVIGQIKKILVHYTMLKFYVRHGMIVDKIHDIIPSNQS